MHFPGNLVYGNIYSRCEARTVPSSCHPPQVQTKKHLVKDSFCYAGQSVWNNLPQPLRHSDSASPSRRTCLIIISKLFFTAVPIPPSDARACVCVCVCVFGCCCTCPLLLINKTVTCGKAWVVEKKDHLLLPQYTGCIRKQLGMTVSFSEVLKTTACL